MTPGRDIKSVKKDKATLEREREMEAQQAVLNALVEERPQGPACPLTGWGGGKRCRLGVVRDGGCFNSQLESLQFRPPLPSRPASGAPPGAAPDDAQHAGGGPGVLPDQAEF